MFNRKNMVESCIITFSEDRTRKGSTVLLQFFKTNHDTIKV